MITFVATSAIAWETGGIRIRNGGEGMNCSALNLAALLPAPIVAAPDVLAYAQATLEGDSPEATRLRYAAEAEQMVLQPSPAG